MKARAMLYLSWTRHDYETAIFFSSLTYLHHWEIRKISWQNFNKLYLLLGPQLEYRVWNDRDTAALFLFFCSSSINGSALEVHDRSGWKTEKLRTRNGFKGNYSMEVVLRKQVARDAKCKRRDITTTTRSPGEFPFPFWLRVLSHIMDRIVARNSFEGYAWNSIRRLVDPRTLINELFAIPWLRETTRPSERFRLFVGTILIIDNEVLPNCLRNVSKRVKYCENILKVIFRTFTNDYKCLKIFCVTS